MVQAESRTAKISKKHDKRAYYRNKGLILAVRIDMIAPLDRSTAEEIVTTEALLDFNQVPPLQHFGGVAFWGKWWFDLR